MRPSNPKQVLILSIVAVGAIGFLGTSILGIGKSVVSRLAEGGEETKSDPVAATRPTDLLGDPFSHPKLALASEPTNPDSKPDAAPKPAQPPNLDGTLPPLPGTRPLQPNVGIVPDTEVQPDETTGNSRKPDGKVGPRVALTAVVKVKNSIAFLSVNGGETRAYRQGDLLAPGFRLIAVGEGQVTIRNAQATFQMAVGQEIQL